MLEFPAAYFVRFFKNHGFLSVDDRPVWRVIKGGSKRYVEKILQGIGDRVVLEAPVQAIHRDPTGVRIQVKGHGEQRFDGVVLACHSDQALRMLADPSDAEREILGAIPYQENLAVLHKDESLMPRRKLAWASWNYHLPVEGQPRVAVSYHMNTLQSLQAPCEFLVTLNPAAGVVRDSEVLREIVYHHPIYTPEGIAAQKRHDEISGVRNTWFCGAYWRYGFHEDGVFSARRVCEQLGVEV